jgi:beta-glucosidase
MLGNSIDVEFEFGHGLSYTTFAYSNLILSPSPSLSWNETLSITVDVHNTGSVSGDHTVLLFVTDIFRSITPPNKELKGYSKLTLASNEQRKIEFQLNQTDLSFIGLNNTRQTEPGLFIVTIGNLQANFTLLPNQSL